MIDTEVMTKNAMPKTFTEKMKLIYWKVMLMNFLKYHPGRNGVPLKYVVLDNVTQLQGMTPTYWMITAIEPRCKK